MGDADVSVIIPAYNAEAVLNRSVQSVLEQTSAVREILIYDDKSPDRTAEVLGELAAKFDVIRPFYGAENLGAGHARTTLLQAAKVRYFAFLDADDEWQPHKIERQMRLISETGAGLCFSAHTLVDVDGARAMRMPPPSVSYRSMLFTNWIPTSSAVVSSDLKGVREMPKIRRRQDYGYWLTLFQQNRGLRAVAIQEPLMTYYRDSHSLSSSRIKNLQGNFEMFRDVAGFGSVGAAGLTLCNAAIRVLRA